MTPEEKLIQARGAAARALQMVVYEAVQHKSPIVDRDVASRLVDSLVLVVLEALAAHNTDSKETKDVDRNVTRA
jgi:hypothetical protein